MAMGRSKGGDAARIARAARQQLEAYQRAGVRFVSAAKRAKRSGRARDKAGETKKQRLLDQLAGEVAACKLCPQLVQNRTQTVFGVGDPSAELCFVGEAPGYEEDKQGEPFVGAAGQLLTRIIAAMGLERSQVYICNVLKCRPPNNRTPAPDEMANCRPFLERQLEILQPRFICALGAVAARALLQTTQSMGKLRGRFHDYRGIPVLCTYHPAYLLRYPAAKRDVWEDIKMLMREMGLKIPQS